MSNWINNLFGLNLSPALSYVVLFVAVVVGLMLLVWIARKLLGGTFVSGGRGRHLRLAVMDATPVDSRRRLVLVRRDDVEHLILIGGPTDVVVEQNIRIDGPRDTRSIEPPAEPALQERLVEAQTLPEEPRIMPARQPVLQQPLQPRPAPQTPAAPYLPARPPIPPRETLPLQPQTPTPMREPMLAREPMPVREPLPAREPMASARPLVQPASPALAPAVAPTIALPRPMAPTPRIEPVAAAISLRPEPAPVSVPASVVAEKPISQTRAMERDLDDSLLADLSESMSFEDDEISPEVSLEKEMESLLGTLDTKKDRIS